MGGAEYLCVQLIQLTSHTIPVTNVKLNALLSARCPAAKIKPGTTDALLELSELAIKTAA